MKKRAQLIGHRFWLFLIAGFVMSCQESAPSGEELGYQVQIPTTIDFNFHVKPILSDRCFACHGPDENKREAGMALHTQEGLFARSQEDTTQFVVVPGDPDASLLIQRIVSNNPGELMPPAESNLSLSDQEIAILRKWVEQGAQWKPHWSFLPVASDSQPTPTDWGSGFIDHWVGQGMQSVGLAPSPRASKGRVLRRLSLDTRGLPPAPDDLAEISTDDFDAYYTQKVDEYLASTDHAERLTSWWLDVARYADTHGYQDDNERQNWPWRDWVIHAFHNNMPYNDFVTWQLAGDLVENANMETILATTFNRNHKITQEGGVIDEEFLVDYVADRTSTTFTAFQGLTLECARCHDHKYDPLSQRDFFQVFDFFNHVPERGRVEYGAHPQPYLTITKAEIDSILHFVNAPDSVLPVHPMVMKEEKGLRTTHVLGRGQYDQPLDEVAASTPSAILPFGDRLQNRLGLAEWMFDKQNPLTARVLVNRVWQLYFGRGIVATPDDFGNQGALPTHPELLDALAARFMESGWDLRALERAILLSETYRQDSKVTEEALVKDPENLFLARAPQLRLSAEVIRDQALAMSGLLVSKVGGPPVKPYQPPGLWAEKTSGGGYTTYQQQKGENLYRKSLYTYWKRTVPPPSMLLFDAPTRDLCMVNRQQTNTPLQALVLLNDPQQLEASRVLAEQLAGNGVNDPEKTIQEAFQLVLFRSGEQTELNVLKELYATELAGFEASPTQADSLISVGEYPLADEAPREQVAALTMVVSTLLNLSETVTRL